MFDWFHLMESFLLDQYFSPSAMQEKMVKGSDFVHETLGLYRTLEDLWDGEV